MTTRSSPTVVELPDELVAEIEEVSNDTGVETFVHQAVRAYVSLVRQRSREEQLAKDYDNLADLYDELAAALADEVWLPLENEALLHTERDANS